MRKQAFVNRQLVAVFRRGKTTPKRTNTNEPACQPNRGLTQPQQLRPETQKPRSACGKRSSRQARTNGTDKNKQETTRQIRKEQQEARHRQGRVPQGHKEQGGGQLSGNRQDGWGPQVRVTGGQRERGCGSQHANWGLKFPMAT